MKSYQLLSVILVMAVCGCATAQITFQQSDQVVVSDIDDTIKTTYVRNTSKSEIISNGLKTKNSFWGMSDLYQEMNKQMKSIEFIYLSGSTSLASSYYSDFLTESGFPKGTLVQKTNFFESTKTYKIRKIKEIITNKKPKTIYFIGDNGEYDPDVLVEIKKQYPYISFFSYIRYAYSGKRTDEQYYKYFTTHFDIAWDLFKNNLIDSTATLNFIEGVNKQFEKEKGKEVLHPNEPALFTKWIDCSGFNTEWYSQSNMLNGMGMLFDHYTLRCPTQFAPVSVSLRIAE